MSGWIERFVSWGVAGGVTAAAGRVNQINDMSPHIYDGVSSLIGRHWGNVTVTMFLVGPAFVMGDVGLDMLTEMYPQITNEQKSVIRKIGAIATIAIATAGNIWVEANTPNNVEFGGDVATGLLGAALITAVLMAPHWIEERRNRS